MSLEIYIGGYQRSGNTFLAKQVENRYGIVLTPDRKYNHNSIRHRDHLDSGSSAPFLVPVRDAKESLISNYIMSRHLRPMFGGSDFDIEQNISVIKDLWEFVETSDKFFISPFEAFTARTQEFFDKLEAFHPELKSNVVMAKTIQEVYKDLQDDEHIDALYRLTEDKLFAIGNLQSRNLDLWGLNSSAGKEDYWLSTAHVPRPRTILYNRVNEMLSGPKYEQEFLYLDSLRKQLVKRYYT